MISLRRFLSHTGGVSAVEFALIAPILLVVLSGVVTGWKYAMQQMEMRTAAKTGANYILQGGADLAAAKSAVLLSWTKKPADATVTIFRQCTCAGTVATCSSVCTGTGSIPQMSVIIQMAGSVDIPVSKIFTTKTVQASREEKIRVR